MTQSEFINELRDALIGNVSDNVIRENIDYYNSYINGQIACGKTAEEVTEQLGNPRLIAKSIIESQKKHSHAGKIFDEAKADEWYNKAKNFFKGSSTDTIWKIVAAVLFVVVVYVIIKLLAFVIGILFKPVLIVLAIVLLCVIVGKLINDNK